jgi:hypothetical protein
MSVSLIIGRSPTSMSRTVTGKKGLGVARIPPDLFDQGA